MFLYYFGRSWPSQLGLAIPSQIIKKSSFTWWQRREVRISTFWRGSLRFTSMESQSKESSQRTFIPGVMKSLYTAPPPDEGQVPGVVGEFCEIMKGSTVSVCVSDCRLEDNFFRFFDRMQKKSIAARNNNPKKPPRDIPTMAPTESPLKGKEDH
jgi:hypothetical protein